MILITLGLLSTEIGLKVWVSLLRSAAKDCGQLRSPRELRLRGALVLRRLLRSRCDYLCCLDLMQGFVAMRLSDLGLTAEDHRIRIFFFRHAVLDG